MRYFLCVSILCVLICSCSNNESNLIINGKVDGLKKGTLYLQKVQDTVLVSVDSMIIDGEANFEFESFIKSPELHYLYLEKLDNTAYNDRIRFFAEEGEITINTTLKDFEDATITGSVNTDKLKDYNDIMSRFNMENVELIKEDFEAQQAEDQDKMIEVAKKFDNNLKRRYLYTVNFAMNNNDLSIAPYLAVSEVFDANIKYLDTIYNNLTPQNKKSLYGKQLKDLIKERKASEK